MPRSFLSAAAALFAGAVAAAPPPVPDEWKEAFAARPELAEPGLRAVETPRPALVATGKATTPAAPATERDREIARKRAELAAYRALYDHLYDRDKAALAVPPALARFADDALRRDAHRRTLEVRGAVPLATWAAPDGVYCALTVTEDGVRAATEFGPAFRAAAGAKYLGAYRDAKQPDDLLRAFECDPDSDPVRAALADHLLSRGYRVAAFLVRSPDARLPAPSDPLAAYLAAATAPAYRKAVDRFQASGADVAGVLADFLAALDGQYGNPDCLNYAGACYRHLGWPQAARVFFAQAVAQAGGAHRHATTNLGLALAELGRPAEAVPHLRAAVEKFPDDPWTAKARAALARVGAKAGLPFEGVEIEDPFADLLAARPATMETAGAKLYRLPDGKAAVVVVASVALKDGSPADRLRAERVCPEKAARDLAGLGAGVEVSTVQRREERVTVTVDATGKASEKSLVDYLEWTAARVRAETKDLPVVGRWRSKDGTVFYLAVGKVVDPKAEPKEVNP